MASQVLGLAEAVGWPFVEKRLAIRAPWRHLMPQFWLQPLAALGPERRPVRAALARSCDRAAGATRSRRRWRSSGPAAAARSGCRSRTRAMRRDSADLVVAPSHDPAQRRQRLHAPWARCTASPARGSPTARAASRPLFAHLPRPLVAVLIGGDNRAYRLTPERFAALADQLGRARAHRASGSPITPSRRTGDVALALLRDAACGAAGLHLGRRGRQPLFRHARPGRRDHRHRRFGHRW